MSQVNPLVAGILAALGKEQYAEGLSKALDVAKVAIAALEDGNGSVSVSHDAPKAIDEDTHMTRAQSPEKYWVVLRDKNGDAKRVYFPRLPGSQWCEETVFENLYSHKALVEGNASPAVKVKLAQAGLEAFPDNDVIQSRCSAFLNEVAATGIEL